jgi:hypothetical protein
VKLWKMNTAMAYGYGLNKITHTRMLFDTSSEGLAAEAALWGTGGGVNFIQFLLTSFNPGRPTVMFFFIVWGLNLVIYI